jgi:spectrin beta
MIAQQESNELSILTQRKTFTAWCNEKINPNNAMKINNLSEDLASGVTLIALSEKLASKTVTHIPTPSTRDQFIYNCSQALALIRSEGIKLSSVDPEDIVNGDQSCLLSIIWALILQYDFNRSDTRTEIKKDILNWLRLRLDTNYNIKITDFLSVWKDGLAICALVDSFQPGVMDPKTMWYC